MSPDLLYILFLKTCILVKKKLFIENSRLNLFQPL
jgi:hypothetical protein